MRKTSSPIYLLCFSPYLGGMELDSIKIATLLSTQFQIHLIVRANTKLADRALATSFPFKVHTINFWGSFDLRCIFGLKNIWRLHGFGPVLFFGASELKSIVFALAPGQCCIVRHGTTKAHSKKDWFHRWLYRKVTHHVTIGEHLRKNVLSIFPGPKTCHVIEPSCLLKKIPRTPNPIPSIFIFGRIIKEKGAMDALLALLPLAQKGHRFSITIQGPSEDDTFLKELKSLAGTFPTAIKISFFGPTTDVQNEFLKHDLFLFPSYGEGVPNALIEALWCGLYPITYDNTCFPEFLKKQFKMQQAKNHDITDLTQKIEQGLAELNNHIPHNQELAWKLFSPERELKDWEQLLAPCLK